MSDLVMVPRSWLQTSLIVAALAFVGIFALGRCSAPDPAPLPAAVQRAVDRRVVQVVIDSLAVQALQRENARLLAQRDSQVAISKATDSAGMKQKRRADTLQAVAIAALTAADSAKAWHAAHDARKLEADSAEASSARKSAIIRADTAIFVAKDSLFAVEHGSRLQSDSLVAQLLPLAERRDQCKILWVVNCPTRKQALVDGVLLGAAAGYAIATKKELKLGLFTLKF